MANDQKMLPWLYQGAQTEGQEKEQEKWMKSEVLDRMEEGREKKRDPKECKAMYKVIKNKCNDEKKNGLLSNA